MTYTVKKVAIMSGVSVRTLRFYDQIGLLKPSYYGDNSYRYYNEKQIFLLQQILFFKELGLPLREIQKLFSQDDFGKVEALTLQKKVLQRKAKHIKELIKRIQKTLVSVDKSSHLVHRERHAFINLKDKILEKSCISKHAYCKQYLLLKNMHDEEVCREKWITLKHTGEALVQALKESSKNNISPSCLAVQSLIRKWVKYFYEPTKEIFFSLKTLVSSEKSGRFFHGKSSTSFSFFILKAFEIFIENEKSSRS